MLGLDERPYERRGYLLSDVRRPYFLAIDVTISEQTCPSYDEGVS